MWKTDVPCSSLPFPFPDAGSHISGLIWAFLLVSAAVVVTLPSSVAIKCLVVSSIFRFIFSLGPETTLYFLGVAIVVFKVRERN